MSRDSYTRYPRAILWLVREGEVTIGGKEPQAQPVFRVHLEPFYLSKLPVTNLQYEAYDPHHVRAQAVARDDDPAVGVNFAGARGYCEWYARVSRKPMRLPTEVEWEYACRAGSETRYFFGEQPESGEPFIWDRSNSGELLPPLADKKPNPFGFCGMLGGVWEWTASLYMPYPATAGDGRDDPTRCGARVLRGGSFRVPRAEFGCGVRRSADPELRSDDIGFRVARSFR